MSAANRSNDPDDAGAVPPRAPYAEASTEDDERPVPPSLPPSPQDPTGDFFVSSLTIALVRHGVTDMTTTQQLSGSSVAGPSLNAAGRVQAARAADAMYRLGRDTWENLAPVTRVIASPMQRTQDTGAALGRRLGVHVETDDRAREVDFGDWEGLTAEQAGARDGDLIRRWGGGAVAAPGGESIAMVGVRMEALVCDLAQAHAKQCASRDTARTIAIASHAVAIKACVAVSLGMEPERMGRIWPAPATYTLLHLRVTSDGTIAERHLLCLGVPTG